MHTMTDVVLAASLRGQRSQPHSSCPVRRRAGAKRGQRKQSGIAEVGPVRATPQNLGRDLGAEIDVLAHQLAALLLPAALAAGAGASGGSSSASL